MANYVYALSNSLVLESISNPIRLLLSGDTLTLTSDAYLVNFGLGECVGFGSSGVVGIFNNGLIAATEGNGIELFDSTGGQQNGYIRNGATGVIQGGDGILCGSSSFSHVTIVNEGAIAGLASGGISSGILVVGGTATIMNTGTISSAGTSSIAGAIVVDGPSVTGSVAGDITIDNSGIIIGRIRDTVTSSVLTLSNSGTIIGDIFSAGALNLDNTGGLLKGNVTAGAAADTINNAGGTITGLVDLGAGDDTFTGGDGAEKVVGGDGNDDVDLGAGNDIFYGTNTSLIGGASDGNDQVDGGSGIDTYVTSVMGAPNSNTINLTDGIVTGVEFGTDHILNFENVVGSGVSDVITGSAVRNVLSGDAGSDSISGLAGNDRIYGGIGADTITGGAGQDVMTGGSGPATGDGFRDTFLFSALSDSGAAGSPRDWITDFTNGAAATADRINILSIDANTTLAGNQAFIWQAAAGAAFTGVKGQLHYAILGGNTYISGDVNGDKIADFSIGLTGSHALAAVDFIL